MQKIRGPKKKPSEEQKKKLSEEPKKKLSDKGKIKVRHVQSCSKVYGHQFLRIFSIIVWSKLTKLPPCIGKLVGY